MMVWRCGKSFATGLNNSRLCVVVVSILRLYSVPVHSQIPKTVSESIGYKQLNFHYKPMTDRRQQARAQRATGYNGGL
jgi:hypothetical protein